MIIKCKHPKPNLIILRKKKRFTARIEGEDGAFHSLVHLFIQQVFIKPLVCGRHSI